MQNKLIARGLAAGLTILAFASQSASAGPAGAHPYFDDQGTLTWYTTLDEAVAAARASGRTIFVEFGRRECHNCRVVVQKILPCTCVRNRLSATCVGLAADCDEPDPRVEALFKTGLPNANTLPFCGFATSDLRWITGFAGLVGADECMRQLDVVESSRARSISRPTSGVPTPAAVPASAGVPVAPTAPTGGACPLPPSADELARSRALLVRAKESAAKSRFGEVTRFDAEAARMSLRVEPAAWRGLIARAATWTSLTLDGAVVACRERRFDDAAKLVATVETEMKGLPAEREAQTGAKALERVRAIEAIAQADRAKARAIALEEFRGTRWTELFRG